MDPNGGRIPIVVPTYLTPMQLATTLKFFQGSNIPSTLSLSIYIYIYTCIFILLDLILLVPRKPTKAPKPQSLHPKPPPSVPEPCTCRAPDFSRESKVCFAAQELESALTTCLGEGNGREHKDVGLGL